MNIPQSQAEGSSTVLALQEHSSSKTRINLACLPCRSHHWRCDGEQPVCSRCKLDSTQCVYAKSRRGGFDKATLLKKRAEKAQMQIASNPNSLGIVGRELAVQPREQGAIPPPHLVASSTVGLASNDVLAFVPDITRAIVRPEPPLSPNGAQAQGSGVAQDYSQQLLEPLNYDLGQEQIFERDLDLYYEFFHSSHPFVLPKTFLKAYWHIETGGMPHLLKVIRFWGSLYSKDTNSQLLKSRIMADALQGNLSPDGFTVQAHILLSIALHSWDELEQARILLDMAVSLALSLEMNLDHYATGNGGGSPVLEESWRRTWWSLYISDLLFTGIRGLKTFSLRTIHATVCLPCAEEAYSSGEIPTPRSLAEYDSRHFADETIIFSSFAYLIDSARVLANVFYVAQEIGEAFDRVVSSIDMKLASWTLNLPRDKRQLLDDGGKIDELIFQAHILINTATVHLHRPRSKLATSWLESSSRCAPIPAYKYGGSSDTFKDAESTHTAKKLVAAKAVITKFTLPAQLATHSPLILCQLGFSSLAYMSACTFVLKGSFWQDAKDLVEVTIGAFKVYAELWPISARTLRQLKTTGRAVFPIEQNLLPNSDLVVSTLGSQALDARNNIDSGVSDGDLNPNVQIGNLPLEQDVALDDAMFEDIFGMLQTADQSWSWNG